MRRMRHVVHDAIRLIWLAIGLVWIAGALRTKRTERKQSASTRMLHVGLATAAFGLLFDSRLAAGPLAWRFLPDSVEFAWIGLALTATGVACAIWARLLLGGNWSASVTLKRGHTLVRRGPYNLVRHPIYSGALLAMAGTAIESGRISGLAAVALALIAWRIKSRMEEAFLEAQFGEQYLRYEREVKALIPFVL